MNDSNAIIASKFTKKTKYRHNSGFLAKNRSLGLSLNLSLYLRKRKCLAVLGIARFYYGFCFSFCSRCLSTRRTYMRWAWQGPSPLDPISPLVKKAEAQNFSFLSQVLSSFWRSVQNFSSEDRFAENKFLHINPTFARKLKKIIF